MKLKDKVALVTGAASGIGREVCRLFYEEGALIAAVDLNPEGLNETADLAGADKERFLTLQADIGKVPEIEQTVKKATEIFGRIDILVNCAGIQVSIPVGMVTEEDWHQTIDVNLKGTFFVTQQVFKVMRSKRYGKIVNLSSIAAAKGGSALMSVYSSSKGGIASLTRALAVEMSGSNINVNAICPGFIFTPMTGEVLEIEELKNIALDQTPLDRIGEPIDVANLALFLVSDDASFITGQTIFVDGGMSIN